VEATGAIWDYLKWIGGNLSDAAVAVWNDPGGAITEAARATAQGVQAAYEVVEIAVTALSDPQKREEILQAIRDLVKESFAEMACEMAAALLEALRSDKPLAASLGEAQAAIEQRATEAAGQIAVVVVGDKGISRGRWQFA
jgi:hypothetical protein